MKLNCKPGDLAMYVGRYVFARGVIVRCVRKLNALDRLDAKNRDVALPAWRVDPPVKREDGTLSKFVSDKALRPIRDQDGEDEMIRIAGLPNKEYA